MINGREVVGAVLSAALRGATFALWPALVLAGVIRRVELPAKAPGWLAEGALHLPQRVFPTVAHHGRVLLTWHWAVLFWIVLSVLFGLAYRRKSVVRSAWISPLAFFASLLAVNAALLWAGLDVLLASP